MTLFYLNQKKINLWYGDFFKLPLSVCNKISGVYDRAALIALPEEVRRNYTREILKNGQQLSEILLISYEYPAGSVLGPPFCVPESEIKVLYPDFSFQVMNSEIEERVLKDLPKFKSVEVIETTSWPTRT